MAKKKQKQTTYSRTKAGCITLHQAEDVIRSTIKPYFPNAKSGLPPVRHVVIAAVQEGYLNATPEKGCWNINKAGTIALRKMIRSKKVDPVLLADVELEESRLRKRRGTPVGGEVRIGMVPVEPVQLPHGAGAGAHSGRGGPSGALKANGHDLSARLRELEHAAQQKVLESSALLYNAQKELNRVRALMRIV